jgi:hypothetical protein
MRRADRRSFLRTALGGAAAASLAPRAAWPAGGGGPFTRLGYAAIIELDAVPEPGGTPKQSAEANKQYAVGVLGLRL